MDIKELNERHIILASGSPRRKEIMQSAGLSFDVIPSNKEEIITEIEPDMIVKSLSRQKAEDIYESVELKDNYLIIGADTMVFYKNEKYGKPKDSNNAFEMLSNLSGNTHQVYTGVTFIYDEGKEKKVHSFSCVTDVSMYAMSPDEIREYISSENVIDKAGAYAIQGKCAKYIEKINGEYNNVVGLPIARLVNEWKQLKK